MSREYRLLVASGLSVRLSARIIAAPTGRIVFFGVKFDVEDFYGNLSINSKFC
jgi:hypothetical protein